MSCNKIYTLYKRPQGRKSPDFTFYSFRNKHATMLAEAGAPIKYTQERLGHKDVTVTVQIYRQVSDAIRKNDTAALEKMLKKAE